MRKLSRHSRVVAVLVGVAIIAVAITLLLGARSAAPTASTQRLSRVLVADFRLLRSSSAAALPRADIKTFSIGGGKVPSADMQFGLDINAARETELSGGVTLWLIPGRSSSCFLTTGPNAGGGGCGENAKLEIRGSESYQRYGETERIVGIVPDGLHVTVRLSDGSSVPVRLNSENAYVIVRPLGDPVVKTTFTGNGRTFSESSIGLRRPLSSPAPA